MAKLDVATPTDLIADPPGGPKYTKGVDAGMGSEPNYPPQAAGAPIANKIYDASIKAGTPADETRGFVATPTNSTKK